MKTALILIGLLFIAAAGFFYRQQKANGVPASVGNPHALALLAIFYRH